MLVGYGRVSTLDQNVSLQVNALQEAGCEKIFTEKASGVQRDRSELQAALAYMRKGDTLVVWKLDRLARSAKQLAETVELLSDAGIGFQSLTERIDTHSVGGKFIFHLFAALSEFERGILRERTHAGLLAAKAKGKVGGRPRSLTPADQQAAGALLKHSEISVKAVAKRMGISIATLYRYFPSARSG